MIGSLPIPQVHWHVCYAIEVWRLMIIFSSIVLIPLLCGRIFYNGLVARALPLIGTISLNGQLEVGIEILSNLSSLDCALEWQYIAFGKSGMQGISNLKPSPRKELFMIFAFTLPLSFKSNGGWTPKCRSMLARGSKTHRTGSLGIVAML